MPDDVFINASGLNELRRTINEFDRRFGSSGMDALKDVNFRVAKLVNDRAQTRAAALGGMERLAASSMKASRAAKSARIIAGGKSAPFFGGAEFGARRNKERRLKGSERTIIGWNQFRDWRGNKGQAGYFLYPTIRQSRADIIQKYDDEMRDLLRDVFPD